MLARSWKSLNVIMEIIRSALRGEQVPLATLGVFLVSLVLYRIGSKHIDELYTAARHHKTFEKQEIELRKLIINEMRRADEARGTAEKAIEIGNKYRWLLMHADAEVGRLNKELTQVRLDLALSQNGYESAPNGEENPPTQH
jgi:hypothetical protein